MWENHWFSKAHSASCSPLFLALNLLTAITHHYPGDLNSHTEATVCPGRSKGHCSEDPAQLISVSDRFHPHWGECLHNLFLRQFLPHFSTRSCKFLGGGKSHELCRKELSSLEKLWFALTCGALERRNKVKYSTGIIGTEHTTVELGNGVSQLIFFIAGNI